MKGFVREWPDGIYKSDFDTEEVFWIAILYQGRVIAGWIYDFQGGFSSVIMSSWNQ
jgi:hypothetical protein